jgi:hypothetical protein
MKIYQLLRQAETNCEKYYEIYGASHQWLPGRDSAVIVSPSTDNGHSPAPANP